MATMHHSTVRNARQCATRDSAQRATVRNARQCAMRTQPSKSASAFGLTTPMAARTTNTSEYAIMITEEIGMHE